MTEASQLFHPPDEDGNVVDRIYVYLAAGPPHLIERPPPPPDAPYAADPVLSAGEILSRGGT
jgi:hypothetical protein